MSLSSLTHRIQTWHRGAATEELRHQAKTKGKCTSCLPTSSEFQSGGKTAQRLFTQFPQLCLSLGTYWWRQTALQRTWKLGFVSRKWTYAAWKMSRSLLRIIKCCSLNIFYNYSTHKCVCGPHDKCNVIYPCSPAELLASQLWNGSLKCKFVHLQEN